MGIEAADLQTLREHLPGGDRLLILGDAVFYFDLDATKKDVATLLGYQRIETIDLTGSPTIIDNLHVTNENLVGQFDAVVDAGTTFCCSDPAAVLRNTWRYTKPGGVIAHITGITGYFGRGYYNIHPALFADFYERNGGECLAATYRTKHRFRKGDRLLGRLLQNHPHRQQRPGRFVTDSRGRTLAFGATMLTPQPSRLPNNVVGVFIFRRGDVDLPAMPMP